MTTPRKSTSKKSRPVKRASVSADAEWIEIPVFIHGINPEKYPGTSRPEYEQLLQGVKAALKSRKKEGFSGEPVFIVWGVPTSQSNVNDQYLAQLERKIDSQVKQSMQGAYNGPFGIYGAVRDLIFFGVTDLFYYVSADGEATLRDHVFNYLGQTMRKLDKGGKSRFSLTIFGHSAGSVISHDLLFHLFGEQDYTKSEEGKVFVEMQGLRKMIDEDRLRIRHLYTFGCPISPLILRSDSLIKIFLADKNLNPESIGLRLKDKLAGPRWVNYWTRHDLASYPVSFFYNDPGKMIQDVEISSKLSPAAAHSGYWTSSEMADHIAQTF